MFFLLRCVGSGLALNRKSVQVHRFPFLGGITAVAATQPRCELYTPSAAKTRLSLRTSHERTPQF
jgi:hypothetical protein